MGKIMKSMAIAFMLLANMQLFAQREKEIKNNEVEGIYLSALDYQQGKLTHPTDNGHKGDKIKLNQFSISQYITVVENGIEQKYYKDSIFAIHLSNKENYRFINLVPCLLTDTSSLYIYTRNTVKTEYKHSGPRRVAKDVPITYYYFSQGKHKAAYALTLENLDKYAIDNTIIHKTIFNKFTTDDMLYQIDEKTGKFELNETLLSVLKK